MMRQGHIFMVAMLMVSIASCGVDPLLPCETDGASSGILCREYRYANGSPVGYVDFVFQGDSVVEHLFYDAEMVWQKTTTMRYADVLLQTVAYRFADKDNVVGSYHYLSNDSLECIVYGAADSSLCYTYEMGGGSIETAYHGTELVRYRQFRYYQTDGRLFRISYFDANDSLLHYRSYDYYFGGIVRIDHSASDHRQLGYEVLNLREDGGLLSAQFTDTTEVVTYRLDNIYDADGRVTESNETFTNGSRKSVFLYH